MAILNFYIHQGVYGSSMGHKWILKRGEGRPGTAARSRGHFHTKDGDVFQ